MNFEFKLSASCLSRFLFFTLFRQMHTNAYHEYSIQLHFTMTHCDAHSTTFFIIIYNLSANCLIIPLLHSPRPIFLCAFRPNAIGFNIQLKLIPIRLKDWLNFVTVKIPLRILFDKGAKSNNKRLSKHLEHGAKE